MSEERASASRIVAGYLQKRNRFYGWNKRIFLLSPQGLTMLANEHFGSAPSQLHSSQTGIVIIGDCCGINTDRVGSLRPKLTIDISKIYDVSGRGKRSLIITAADIGQLELRASSVNDRNRWISHIRSEVRSCAILDKVKPLADPPQHTAGDDSQPNRPLTANPCEVPQAPNEHTSLSPPKSLDEIKLSASKADMLQLPDPATASETAGCGIENGGDANPQSQQVFMAWRRAVLEDLSLDGSIAQLNLVSTSHADGQASSLGGNSENDNRPANQVKRSLEELSANNPAHTTWLLPAANIVNHLPTKTAEYSSDIQTHQRHVQFEIAATGAAATRMSDPRKPLEDAADAASSQAADEPSMPPAGFLNNGSILSLGKLNLSIDINNLDMDKFFEGDDAALPFSTSSSLAKLDASSTIPVAQLGTLSADPQKADEAQAPVPLDTPKEPRHSEKSGLTDAQSSNTTTSSDSSGHACKDTFYSFAGSNAGLSCSHMANESASAATPCSPQQNANSSQEAATATSTGSATTDPKPKPPCMPSDSLTSSIANMSIYDIGITDWSSFLGSSPMLPVSKVDDSSRNGAPYNALPHQAPGCAAAATTQSSLADLLNSPEARQTNGDSPAVLKSIAALSRLNTSRSSPVPSTPTLPATVGLQPDLLSKYSDSLNASKSLMAIVGRATRPKTVHEWNTSSGSIQNARSTSSGRSVEVVQYTHVGAPEQGVNKVVKGQLAKGMIQKENASGVKQHKSGIRRVRRVKSESKIPCFKPIHLRLDGSVAGASNALGLSRVGTINGPPDKSSGGNSTALDYIDAKPTGGSSPVSSAAEKNASVLSEFNVIQSRLKVAEAQKKPGHHNRLDADNVRIADIIETKQDTPIGVQLQEKRNMQLMKQHVLLKQQIELQKQQIELQKLQMEQKLQHQQFMQQSLGPLHKANTQISPKSGGLSKQQSAWQGRDDGNNDSYTSQWVQRQNIHGANGALHQLTGHGQQVVPIQQPVAPQSYQQQLHNTPPAPQISGSDAPWSARSFSYYARSTAPSFQSIDSIRHGVSRASSMSIRRQATGTFVRSVGAPSRPPSIRSGNTLESGYGNAGYGNAGYGNASYGISPPVQATADPLRDESAHTTSPALSSASTRRTQSLRQKLLSTADDAPPVPALPPAILAMNASNSSSSIYSHHSYQSLPPPPPPPVPSQMLHPPLPAHRTHQPAPPTYGHQGYTERFPYGWQSIAEMQRLERKRSEMSPSTPSLLQRLDMARDSGILPSRQAEKMPYTQGAYQNLEKEQPFGNGTTAQLLGNGNTLLIDRLHESELSRSAFLKKISRSHA